MSKYDEVFTQILGIDEEMLKDDLKRDECSSWDSMAHITLVAEIEDVFEIMMNPEDILAFNSYETGKAIVKKYIEA